MCPEVLGEGFFCFPRKDWEGVCKAIPEALGIKYRSEFNHGLTNRG